MRGFGAGGVAVAVLVTAMTATGCGEGETDGGLLAEEASVSTPYSGPLRVPHKEYDEDSPRATKAESGAAGMALECDGEIASGGFGGNWSKRDGGATPEDGLRTYFEVEQPDVPRSGYRVERRDKGRVLFSYDVDGRTKVAVIVAKDQPHRPGWGPETTASCDIAEFPPSFSEERGLEIWTDGRGRRLPLSTISSSQGSEHCDWQSAHFLELGSGADRVLYARDPKGVLDGMLTAAYDGDATLPDDARDTGYRRGEKRLWLSEDRTKAYVRTSGTVEMWPAVKPRMGCA
ncbi:hypothetical protein [Streptomyces fructofermentans]|uniref:Lipoprotein n=1 Tax=Streptomyces fructofermentans TaxID=152141 RepID=A0A918NRZ4_9ACTN|nr:hypothetical protein [Streptomyces fructofermentans]GGX90615.1 hypothetical protein GCM10010515_67190 [Streptomyces fructofermentans]